MNYGAMCLPELCTKLALEWSDRTILSERIKFKPNTKLFLEQVEHLKSIDTLNHLIVQVQYVKLFIDLDHWDEKTCLGNELWDL